MMMASDLLHTLVALLQLYRAKASVHLMLEDKEEERIVHHLQVLHETMLISMAYRRIMLILRLLCKQRTYSTSRQAEE